jgi:hypothetical protein
MPSNLLTCLFDERNTLVDKLLLVVLLLGVLNLVVMYVYPLVKNMLGSNFEGFTGGCGNSYGGEGYKNM